MEKILEYLMKLTPEEMRDRRSAEDFSRHFMSYVEVSLAADIPAVITAVLSGTLALLIEGYDQAVMIDARTYPARGVEEPEDDKVLRGAHDGFVETLIFNTALIRRRIRDPQLTMEYLQVGSTSKTDLVLCYMDERVNHKQLRDLRDKLKGIDIPSLTMGQESLAECLLRRQWYNPFPKVRYTERPDCASANVAEGKILLIVDNSPAVMILPTSIFDFIQDTNDFYFPPLVGTYLRFVRGIVFFLTLFLTPIWYLLMQNPDMIPPWLEFVRIKEPNTVPIIIQLLVIEIMIDGVKLASLNTPGALNNAFGMVGALLLGEFAITAGLFVPEVMLYMAFVAVANFTQPSFELGYAFKLFRMLFLILTALFNLGLRGRGGAAVRHPPDHPDHLGPELFLPGHPLQRPGAVGADRPAPDHTAQCRRKTAVASRAPSCGAGRCPACFAKTGQSPCRTMGKYAILKHNRRGVPAGGEIRVNRSAFSGTRRYIE